MRHIVLYLIILSFFTACGERQNPGRDLTDIPYAPTAYVLKLPEQLDLPPGTAENPLTREGVELGRYLFYDPVLSAGQNKSCASCHRPEEGFSGGQNGRRTAPSLLHSAYIKSAYGWDGRWSNIRSAISAMLSETNYLGGHPENMLRRLQESENYPLMFRKAFGITNSIQIDEALCIRALSQFLSILIGGESKYDKVIAGKAFFSPAEQDGADMYFDANPLLPDAECAHCHIPPNFFSTGFANNGLDSVTGYMDFKDAGRGAITGTPSDTGKFKIPTLRNVALRKQYMHDGRYHNLKEVIKFYNSGGHDFNNYSKFLHPLGLSAYQREALYRFLLTLTDSTLRVNPDIITPF